MRYLLLSSLLAILMACQTPDSRLDYLSESEADRDQRLAWWRDARFGLFIHWGPSAVLGGEYQGDTIAGASEWIMHTARIPISDYEPIARTFAPQSYDPKTWVLAAKAAGMKYLVITSKHHDGFCIWDSKVSDYDAVDAAAAGRDLLAPLRDACRKHGLRFGLYHSIMDWHHPDAQGDQVPGAEGRLPNPRFPQYVEAYLKPQLRELITTYDPDILWFDGEWIPEYTHEMGLDLYNFVRHLKPGILINNRVDKGRQGMQGMNKVDDTYAGDFGTPEQEVLARGSTLDWEACMTMNQSWGYKASDHAWKSTQTLIHHLIDIAAKGGNYLLNVGPDAQGRIPAPSLDRLAAMGRWMDINGEAIYGSRLWARWSEGADIRYLGDRADSSRVYAALLRWPGQTLRLRGVEPQAGSAIHLLGHEAPLSWTFDPEAGLKVTLPETWQDSSARPVAHAWVLRMTAQPSRQVPAPRIGNGQTDSLTEDIFWDTTRVVLSVADPEARIHYTLDGNDPNENNPQYETPLVLTRPTEVRAAAFAPGQVSSPVVSARFYRSPYQGLHLAHAYSPNYPAAGRLALIDGKRGQADFHDPAWQGYEGADLILTLDLGRIDTIRRVMITFLNQQSDWIFLPQEVNFELSTDGETFTELSSFAMNLAPDDAGPRIHPFALSFPAEPLRYLRIHAHNVGTCPDWHPGAGGKAWLFVDEVIVE